jgi:hypothetical protein
VPSQWNDCTCCSNDIGLATWLLWSWCRRMWLVPFLSSILGMHYVFPSGSLFPPLQNRYIQGRGASFSFSTGIKRSQLQPSHSRHATWSLIISKHLDGLLSRNAHMQWLQRVRKRVFSIPMQPILCCFQSLSFPQRKYFSEFYFHISFYNLYFGWFWLFLIFIHVVHIRKSTLFLWYWDLNSGPKPWATAPAFFVIGFSR